MSFRILRASACIASAVVLWSGAAWADGFAIAPATALTIVLDGTLGPVLSGSDPASLDGQSATITVTAKTSLNPYKTTVSSASYHIPAGDITVTVNGSNYTSTSRSSMIVKLGKKADLLTFKGTFDIRGQSVNVTDVSSLQTGSWTKSVLQHPVVFSPSPQNLSEPSSTFTYTVASQTTVLGVTGTANN